MRNKLPTLINLQKDEETEFEKLHPFKTLETFNDKPEDIDFIDEEYAFEMEKWFAGFDIENEDVEILEIKVYTPCKWNGNKYNNIEAKIHNNLRLANAECSTIFVAHNTPFLGVPICSPIIFEYKKS